MERFADYYGGSPDIPDPRPARIERLVFLPIPEVATRLGALLASEIDISEKVPPHATDLIERDRTTRLSASTGTRTFFIGLNCARAPFDDLRVRKALAHGVDIRRMVERILGGCATVLAGPLVPAAFGFDRDLEPHDCDPRQATALLREAGVEETLAVELDCQDTDRELAEAAAAQLSELGISVRPRVWKWDVLQPLLANGERAMFLTSWGNASLDPAGILPPLFITGGRGNYMGYSNGRVDEALGESDLVFDPDRRRALFVEVQRILHEDVPAVFGWATQEIYGIRQRVQNWEARPDAMLMMHRVRLGDGSRTEI
jgi:peptide/nickel transport system substrate-binding protein